MVSGALKSVVFAAGGTGGHLFPAVAVADVLRGEDPDIEITFVGTGREIEGRVLSGGPYDYVRIASPRLERSLHPKNLWIPFGLTLALVKSLSLLKKERPQVVLGTGSYGSIPVIVAAHLKRIPAAILEQNVVPSVSNRLLARFADCVCLPFDTGADWARRVDQAVVTGNPIRPVEGYGTAQEERVKLGLNPELFTVAVIGGSQGAARVAGAARDALELLADKPVQFIVQSAPGVDIEIDDQWSGRLIVEPFFENIYGCYAAADLLVARAGSGLNEVLAFGKPMILVPYPYSAHGHQERNAEYVAAQGAAQVIDDNSLSGRILAERITVLMGSDELNRMAEAAKSLGRPDAAKRVAEIIRRLAA